MINYYDWLSLCRLKGWRLNVFFLFLFGRLEVVWSEKVANLLDLAYKVGCPIVVGGVVMKGIAYRVLAYQKM